MTFTPPQGGYGAPQSGQYGQPDPYRYGAPTPPELTPKQKKEQAKRQRKATKDARNALAALTGKQKAALSVVAGAYALAVMQMFVAALVTAYFAMLTLGAVHTHIPGVPALGYGITFVVLYVGKMVSNFFRLRSVQSNTKVGIGT